MTLITIVTHAAMPEGVGDDHMLAHAIKLANGTVRFAVWNDPLVDWSAGAITVVRSAWDYHLSPKKWFAWIDRAASETRLINAPTLIRWNSDKRSLLDLEKSQIPIVPSFLIEKAEDLTSACTLRGWSDIVVKPVIGASAFGTRRFHQDQMADEAPGHAAALLKVGPVLVQAYQKAIEHERERSLVYIGGCFSHAFTKPGLHAGLGDEELSAHIPDGTEYQLAEDVLAQLPERAEIARIDMHPSQTGPILMEAELIEPQLALHLGKGSATLFAATLMKLEGEV